MAMVRSRARVRQFLASNIGSTMTDRARFARAMSRARLFQLARGRGGLRFRRSAPGRAVEFKSIDSDCNGNVDSGGRLVLLNGCTRGGDINQREGRQINIRSVELHAKASVTDGTGIDQVQRYMIVYDLQTNGAAPTVGQILTSGVVQAMRKLDNRQRFRILWDERVQLNASAEPGSQKVLSFYRRLFLRTTFNEGDTGNVSDIATGSLYFICFSDRPAGGTAGSCACTVRVRFTEA